MKRYLLTTVTVLLYAGLLIWKFSGGLTGNELLFSAAAFFLIPSVIPIIAGIFVFRCKLNIIPMTAVLIMQCVLPQIAFRSGLHIGYVLIAAAACAIGTAIGGLLQKIKQ